MWCRYIGDGTLFGFQWIIGQNGMIVHGMKNEMKHAFGKLDGINIQYNIQMDRVWHHCCSILLFIPNGGERGEKKMYKGGSQRKPHHSDSSPILQEDFYTQSFIFPHFKTFTQSFVGENRKKRTGIRPCDKEKNPFCVSLKKGKRATSESILLSRESNLFITILC